jgi:cytochrome P450
MTKTSKCPVDHAGFVPDLFSAEHVADPFRTYETMREGVPTVWDDMTSSFLVSRYEDIREVLRDNKRYSTSFYKKSHSLVYGQTFIELGGKEHTKGRGLVSPFMNGAGLEHFSVSVERKAEELFLPLVERERQAIAAGTKQRGEVDLVTEFADLYPLGVMAAMFGIPEADFDQLRDWTRAMILFIENLADFDGPRERGYEARREWEEYILPIIAERRERNDGDDLISILCRHEADGERMSDEDIKSFLAMMLVAGSDTSSHQFTQLVVELMRHPDQLEAVRADRSLVPAAMAESMRFSSVVQWTQRVAIEDVVVGGIPVAAGQTVTLLLGGGNRDPERFGEPDAFDIYREDHKVSRAFTGSAEHLAFGGGRHYCLGAQLARNELDIALNLVLDHMDDLRFADGFVPKPENVFIRMIPKLDVTFLPNSGRQASAGTS